MKDFFKAKDFAQGIGENIQQINADYANEKLNKLIESWPVVYGSNKRPLDGWNEKSYESTTHKARLAFIEEIKKEPCKHEPIQFQDDEGNLAANFICRHCGVELVATWSEKK